MGDIGVFNDVEVECEVARVLGPTEEGAGSRERREVRMSSKGPLERAEDKCCVKEDTNPVDDPGVRSPGMGGWVDRPGEVGGLVGGVGPGLGELKDVIKP